MTRLEALTKLKEAVEAGRQPKHSYDALGDAWVYAHDIYISGSLDAARALHEAVLPKWAVERVTMWPGKNGQCSAHVWGTHERKDGERWHNHLDGRASAQSICPARAWLIAILSALIAQEQNQ